MLRFVFLNVGSETDTAGLLVRSIRRRHKRAIIVQVTDLSSPAVEGVDEVRRLEGDAGSLMEFRLRAFSTMDVNTPTWFLDTDMLLAAPLPRLTGVGLCERSFARDEKIKSKFGDIDLSEYKGRTLMEVYPILACATFVHRAPLWSRCLDILATLDPKFWRWFGDQEALRIYATSGQAHTRLPESTYACLPEHFRPGAGVKVLHFKGARKALMRDYAVIHDL
jgi:hypothetical protein